MEQGQHNYYQHNYQRGGRNWLYEGFKDCNQQHDNRFNNKDQNQSKSILSQDEGDLLGDAVVLPSQVDIKVPSVLFIPILIS